MSKSSHQFQVKSIALRIKAAGVTQNEVASALGVNQSQVSRLLGGHVKSRSKLLDDLCIYAETRLSGVSKESVRENPELIAALAEVWDGTPTHAKALATIIRSLATLSAPTTRQKPKT